MSHKYFIIPGRPGEPGKPGDPGDPKKKVVWFSLG